MVDQFNVSVLWTKGLPRGWLNFTTLVPPSMSSLRVFTASHLNWVSLTNGNWWSVKTPGARTFAAITFCLKFVVRFLKKTHVLKISFPLILPDLPFTNKCFQTWCQCQHHFSSIFLGKWSWIHASRSRRPMFRTTTKNTDVNERHDHQCGFISKLKKNIKWQQVWTRKHGWAWKYFWENK